MTATAALFVDFLLGYLLGSIPFGLLLTRYAGGRDIRTVGSGNIGATNVLRTGNKLLAAATLALDMLKGTAAVLIAGWLARYETATVAGFGVLLAGLGAFVGHIFPVWLKFKGGKGVATFLGVLFGLVWQAALIVAAIWILVAVLFRYSSLAALVATAAAPLVIYLFGYPLMAALIVILAAIVWLKHHENIMRLWRGLESRIGSK